MQLKCDVATLTIFRMEDNSIQPQKYSMKCVQHTIMAYSWALVVCKKYKNDHTSVTELSGVCIGCQYVLVFSTKYCSLCTRRSLMALQHIWLI